MKVKDYIPTLHIETTRYSRELVIFVFNKGRYFNVMYMNIVTGHLYYDKNYSNLNKYMPYEN